MSGGVTIVTQTRVLPQRTDEFGTLTHEVAVAVAGFEGFVEQTIIPPTPPAQLDWVTMQWFDTAEEAAVWLRSPGRRELEERIATVTQSPPNTYLVKDRPAGAGRGSTATAVIATRVAEGRDDEYRAWQHRIAAAGSIAPGYEGHRFEPPIPGVQETWISVLWFDTDEHLQGWLDSPDRAALMTEAAPLIDTISTRSVRTGFDQWFDTPVGAPAPAAWKMSMLVLVVLYPCVFLIDTFLVPPLTERGVPFWLTLFGANTLTVVVLGVTVPLVSRRFTWWLTGGRSASARRRTVQGAAVVVGVYLLCLAATATYSALA